MKKFFLLLFLLILSGSSLLYYVTSKRSSCFFPSYVIVTETDLPFQESVLPEEIQPIINQSFKFLGCGNQSFAFLSDDRKYVLKIVRYQQLKSTPEKLSRVLRGFQTAKDYDKEYSRLLYAHLHPSQNLKRYVHVTDRLGREHLLPLDNLFFAIQEQGVPLRAVLSSHLKIGEIEKAREKIEALFAMYRNSMMQGIYDEDHNIMHNTGFVRDQPMRIDIGKLTYNPKYQDTKLIEKEIEKLKSERVIPWLKRYYPQYASTEFN